MFTLALTAGCKNGSDGKQTIPIYDRLQQARQLEDPLERAEALIQIANEYSEQEDFLGASNSLNDAVEAADAVELEEKPGDRARVHISLAGAWHTARDNDKCEEAYEEAEDALEKIEEAAEKTNVLIDLALLKAKLEEREDATKDLKAAEESAGQIGDPYEHVDMLAWITYGYVQLENKEEAKRILDAALTLVESQEGPGEKGRLLAVVGREQVITLEDRAAGMATLGKALEVARQIEDNPNLRANVLVDIAENLLKVDDKDQAREALDEGEKLARGRSDAGPVLTKIELLRKQF
jgi:tetratricopeptide (TPR) repeat protein